MVILSDRYSRSGCLASPQLINVTELELSAIFVALMPFKRSQIKWLSVQLIGLKGQSGGIEAGVEDFFVFFLHFWD